MRIAHLSDLHVLDLDGVGARRFLNKRFTGWVNLRVKREHKHRPGHVRAVAEEVSASKPDHVVITGDLTNLALQTEFAAVSRLLEETLELDPHQISVVPGNHDLYTRGAMRSRRFSTYLAPYVQSDLPHLAANLPLGRFPFVKLQDHVAIIGLTSAVPRPPLMASGVLGRAQLAALIEILAHDDVKSRVPVVLLHHPPHNPPSKVKTVVEGLWDADGLRDALRGVPSGLVLHGHLHRRLQTDLTSSVGRMLSVGATSASLHHEDEHRMAGFNVYDVGEDGELSAEAHVYDPDDGSFSVRAIPTRGW